MKPDRSNYEIWLIDWLDGNLDEARTEQLMAFLDENPDLREEADSLSLPRIVPEDRPSIGKNNLKKSPKDLPLSQIEYLSVAYLENDLSDEQIKDLNKNIAVNPDSRSLFKTIQKTRLTPGDYKFSHKNRLLRKTLAERILRISLVGLSAAAAVTFLVVSFLALPRTLRTENESIAVNTAKDTIVIRSGKALTYKENAAYAEEMPVRSNSPEIAAADIPASRDQNIIYVPENPEVLPGRNTDYFISAVPVLSGLEIDNEIKPATLVASDIKTMDPRNYDPERGRIRRFIASTFREKLLKDKVYDDTPLQPYEIAEASIEGLNKLLGWEMALVRTSDQEGELQSYYFSSRVLKFNAPVKKSNPSL